MSLIYKEDKFFIGLVKFFDSIKGFGYIASNNCGMTGPAQKRDFYIDVESFVEDSAKKEGLVVVFQVDRQNNGRIKAVNVRNFKNNEGDYRLAMNYYGEYEMVQNKNDLMVNLFNRIGIPRCVVAEHVKTIIQKEKKSSNPHIVEHLIFFIKHYKENDTNKSNVVSSCHPRHIRPRHLSGDDTIKSNVVSSTTRHLSPQKQESPKVFFPDRYIFDRDFIKEEKTVWSSLVELLNENETVELLKVYPSYCKYVSNPDVLTKWINTFYSYNSTLVDLQGLLDLFPFLPEMNKEIAEKRLSIVIEYKQQAVLRGEASFVGLEKYPALLKYITSGESLKVWIREQYTTQSSINELQSLKEFSNSCMDDIREDVIKQLEEIADNIISALLRKNADNVGASEKSVNQIIEPYKTLTSNNHDEEIQECLKHIRYRAYKRELDLFRESNYSSYRRDNLFKSLNVLKNYVDELKDEISIDMRVPLDIYVSEEKYTDAVILLKQLEFLGDGIIASYNFQLKPLICASQKKRLLSLITSPNTLTVFTNPISLDTSFFDTFNTQTSIFEDDEKEALKKELLPIIIQSNSLQVLSVCYEQEWLDKSTVLKRLKELVSTWNYAEINNFIFYNHGNPLFNYDNSINSIIVEKALGLVADHPLSVYFDGRDEKDGRKAYSSNPEIENCYYLKNLEEYICKSNNRELWEKYINSRGIEDSIVLYNHGLIGALTDSAISYVVDSISLDNVKKKPNEWYCAPEIEDKNINNILKKATSDVFPFIEKRLAKMDISSDTIPLVVLLVELLSINKPKDNDYSGKRLWKEKLNHLKESHPDKAKLSVILGTIYSGVSASSSSLNEVVHLLPPYAQIRCIKKLFMLSSKNGWHFTAEQLHGLITDGKHKLCFPLEITFCYLKMREKDSSATLSNKNMLELLEGREDHSDWVWIIHMMTPCKGRCSAVSLVDNHLNTKRGRYYNGYIIQDYTIQGFMSSSYNERLSSYNGDLKLYIPQKMVDENLEWTKYNNKYYNDIIDLISITFKKEEYKIGNTTRDICYTFDNSHKIELFSLARFFNIKYGNLDNYLDFQLGETSERFCECRLSDKLDNRHEVSFYWCENKPCFRPPLRYMLDYEWEKYTILDFMRILNIPADYVNKSGVRTRFGHYIILSSFFVSFAKFYAHLKCRQCGKLLKPISLSNFHKLAVTEFHCNNEECAEFGNTVYLNHCFNTQKCNATIDSRDSKMCPNGQYICPECGACCSTNIFRRRLENHNITGGYITDRLLELVNGNKGHWEKGERYCYKCGSIMKNKNGVFVCDNCDAHKAAIHHNQMAPSNSVATSTKKSDFDDELLSCPQ